MKDENSRWCALLFVLVLGPIQGCRDYQTAEGLRPRDLSILSGSPESRGGVLASGDSYETRTADLSNVQRVLTQSLGVDAEFDSGDILISATGNYVELFEPETNESPQITPVVRERPYLARDVERMGLEYETLCQHPIYSAYFPPVNGRCNPIRFDTAGPLADGDVIDSVDISWDGNVRMFWTAERIEGGDEPTDYESRSAHAECEDNDIYLAGDPDGAYQPVLAMELQPNIDIDTAGWIAWLANIDVEDVKVHIRTKLWPCPPADVEGGASWRTLCGASARRRVRLRGVSKWAGR